MSKSPEWEKVKFLHLLGSYFGIPFAAVASVYREQTRKAVEVLLAIDVIDVMALSAFDDRHVFVLEQAVPGEVHPEVRLG